MKQDRWLKYWLLAPAFLLLICLMVYPLIFAFHNSFFSYLYGRRVNFVGLHNWIQVFQDKGFWDSVLRTLLYAVIAIPIEVVIALGLALIYVDLRGKVVGILRTIVIVPFIVMPLVSGIIWKLIFASHFGLANYLLSIIGVKPVHWLSSQSGAVASVIIMDFWMWIPFIFLILLAGLQALPDEPFEAAKVDGATAWQRFKSITFPLIQSTLMIAVTLRIIDAIRIFDQVFGMTKGGPGVATQFASLHVGHVAFTELNFGEASVELFILFAIMFLLVSFFYFISRRSPR